MRYAIPVIPFFFFYVVTALEVFRRRAGLRAGVILEGAVAMLFIFCYVTEDRTFIRARIEGGISTPGFAELCQYISAKTSVKDIFVFGKPRVLSLYTRRPASVYPENGTPELVWRYSRSIHARYVVVTDVLEADAAILRPFIRDYAAHLRLAFSNSNFRLYEILD